jgi:hypothetical protein
MKKLEPILELINITGKSRKVLKIDFQNIIATISLKWLWINKLIIDRKLKKKKSKQKHDMTTNEYH